MTKQEQEKTRKKIKRKCSMREARANVLFGNEIYGRGEKV
jgi:hypothetical protein